MLSVAMRRWSIIVALTAGPILLAYAIYYPYSSAARQARNMRIAEQFAPTVRAAIAGDQRFKYVDVFKYTDKGGCLGVGGFVHQGDLAELKRRIEATNPPVLVDWLVDELDAQRFERYAEGEEAAAHRRMLNDEP